MQVEAVADHLAVDLVALQARSAYRGAVHVEQLHRVEQMGGAGHSMLYGLDRRIVVCGTVAHRHHYARVAAYPVDQVHHALDFRGKRDVLHPAARECDQFLQKRPVGLPDEFRRHCPLVLLAEEGAFEMDAHHVRATDRSRERLVERGHELCHLVLGVGHDGKKHAGDAMAGVEPGKPVHVIPSRDVVHVYPVGPVGVDVDEARQHQQLCFP